MKRIANLAFFVSLFSAGALIIFFFLVKTLGTREPDPVHSYFVHLRGFGDFYVYPVIGISRLIAGIAFCGGALANGILRLFARDDA